MSQLPPDQREALLQITLRAEDLRVAIRSVDPTIGPNTCAALNAVQNAVWLSAQGLRDRLNKEAEHDPA